LQSEFVYLYGSLDMKLVVWLLLIAGTGVMVLRGQSLQPVAPSSQSENAVLNSAKNESKTSILDTSQQPKIPGVEMIPLVAPSNITGRKDSYSLKVTGSDWVDTGVVLSAGDHVDWSATGTLKISDGREATPDGLARGWKDLIRQFPMNNANMGAVVGRIGGTEAVPFLIGAKKDGEITQTGHLYLAANVSSDLTSTGSFEVKIKLSAPAKSAAAPTAPTAANLMPGVEGTVSGSGVTGGAGSFEAALSPALFAEIPRRVGDQQGNPGDMVNFSLIGTKDQVLKSFEAAGWTQVDKTTQDAVVHGLLATLQHQSYVEMPMSTLYLFGRPQDLSYARAAPLEVAAIRHHLRVWQTTKIVDGKPMWVGSATHDNGFEKDERTGGVTHHIDAKIDEERDFIEKSFAAAGVLVNAAYVMPANPLQSARTATGGSFESDGRIVVLELR
jgi:LssY C-terminus